jgi:virulence factor Mce-like protein
MSVGPSHGTGSSTNGTAAIKHRREERRYIRVAVIGALLIAACFYAAFVKQLPFSSHFVIRGVFSSANQLQSGNPVRIAGLDIGKVTGVTAGPGNTSIVSMNIDNPSELHADASLAIEPRLLFEGNFYVNVNPGTPAAPAIRSDATVPLSHTTTPVQLDQVLNVLDQPTRYSLKGTIAAFAGGLGRGHGTSTPPGAGYEGLRLASRQLDAALPSVTQVAYAAEGTRPGDLSRAIGSSSDVTTQLAQNPAALADIVTNFDRVVGALSANDTALAQDVQGLDNLMHIAPPTFTALDRALPTLTRFAADLRPTLRAGPSTLDATTRLMRQVAGLVSQPELPRLLTALAPATHALPTLEQKLEALFPLVTSASMCVSRNIFPAINAVLQDGATTSGRPAWQDLLHLADSLAGGSSAFDGNGTALRAGVTQGTQVISGLIPGLGVLNGSQLQGVRPKWLGFGVTPPYRPDQQCDNQPLPAINMSNSATAFGGFHAIPTPARAGLSAKLLAEVLGGPAARARALSQLLGTSSPSSPSRTRRTAGGAAGGSSPVRKTRPDSGAPAASAGTGGPTKAATSPAPSDSPTPSAPSNLLGSPLSGAGKPLSLIRGNR